MALERERGGGASASSIFIVVLSLFVGIASSEVGKAHHLTNAIYVFGDSTMDVGNNNYLPHSKAKANVPFYGIDFPGSIPTGRFSNGFNTADELAKLMGFPMSPPPFLSLSTPKRFNKQMTKGINFASGASGILNQTGIIVATQIIPMSTQIEYFATVSSNLSVLMGPEKASDFLSNCIFLISTGSNDLFEYSYGFIPLNETQFLSNLTSEYKKHLMNLYGLGARKFAIMGGSKIGCCPSQRIRNKTEGGCFEELNELSRKFHLAFEQVLSDLHSDLEDMQYALGNSFDMTRTPEIFKEFKKACCGSGDYNGGSACNSTLKYCHNRNKYLFWDWYHPSQAASKIAAQQFYRGTENFVTPINFQQLVLG